MQPPPPPRVFTGEETASDILRIVLLDDFLPDGIKGARAEVAYLEDVPYLIFRGTAKRGLGDFSCTYRLDRMMETVFPECERLYDEAQSTGLVGTDEYAHRNVTVRHLVRFAMNQMLHRLLLLQLTIFQENFDETIFITSGMLIHALTKDREADVRKAANSGVKKLLEKTIEQTAGRNRSLLTAMLNSLPTFHIPIGVGRPSGSTKSEKQKSDDARKFAKEIEDAARSLYNQTGKAPSRTDVARFLKPGVNPKTGTDSRLSVFTKKVKHLGLDFEEIVNRVCGVVK